MKAFFKSFRRWLMILAILMMLVLLITPNVNWIVLNEGRYYEKLAGRTWSHSP